LFDTLSQVIEPKELGTIAKGFIQNIPYTGRKNTVEGKLQLLDTIVKGKVITNLGMKFYFLLTSRISSNYVTSGLNNSKNI
jgi:hypothetical protein